MVYLAAIVLAVVLILIFFMHCKSSFSSARDAFIPWKAPVTFKVIWEHTRVYDQVYIKILRDLLPFEIVNVLKWYFLFF